MVCVHRAFRAGLGAALLLAGFSAGAWGQTSPPVAPGQNLNVLTRIKGAVVCVGCSLEEVREEEADSGHLYELRSAQGKAVFRVDWVDDASRWASITLGNRLWVRAAAPVFQELTAEANLFKEVEITGLLSSNRTLDVAKVKAFKRGESAPPGGAGRGALSDYLQK
jgi:hypothetical protein